MHIDEIIQMSPVKRPMDIKSMYETTKFQVSQHQAVKLHSLDIGGPKTEIYKFYDSSFKIFVLDQSGNPVFYSAMKPFHNGLKTGVVHSGPGGSGQKFGVRIYKAMSDRFNVPLYSDSTQTDASRIGIWGVLNKLYPGRVQAYNQKEKVTKQDIKPEDVYEPIPPGEENEFSDNTLSNTLLLKFLSPNELKT